MEERVSERTDSLAAELLKLQNADGKIVPAEAVKWARRNKRSRLHAALEWDDEIAGERYRIWQVRELIAVHITEDGASRRFVSLSIDRSEGGYRQLDDVMARQDLKEIMLGDALAELERTQRKYDRLTELSEVWQAAAAARRRHTPQREAAD